MADPRALDSPDMRALVEKLATWPHGLGFLHLADLETLSVELHVHPDLLVAARDALETQEGRARLIEEVRRARAAAGGAPCESWEPPPAGAVPPRPAVLSPGELIDAADGDSLGREFLEEGHPESVAVHFHVHPRVVFAARELLAAARGAANRDGDTGGEVDTTPG